MAIKKVTKKIAPKKTATKKMVSKLVKKAPAKTVKKSVKKTAAKKVAPKKTAVKKHVRALVCAPGEQCFWTSDGQVLEDLNQLQLAFGTMGDEVFLHHVTKEKNDFAEWVEHVLSDADCAADLRRAKKPSSARTVVIRFLRLYNL